MFPTTSLNDHPNFPTSIDDFHSLVTSIYSKSSVVHVFNTFKIEVENQLARKQNC